MQCWWPFLHWNSCGLPGTQVRALFRLELARTLHVYDTLYAAGWLSGSGRPLTRADSAATPQPLQLAHV